MGETSKRYEVNDALIRELLQAIEDNSTVLTTLSANYQHQQSQINRIQTEIDEYHIMLYQDTASKPSIQTVLVNINDRLKRMEAKHACMSRILLSMAGVLATTLIIWVASSFLDMVVKTRTHTVMPPAITAPLKP